MRRVREVPITDGMRAILERFRRMGPIDMQWPPTVYELSDGRFEVEFGRSGGIPPAIARADTPEEALGAIARSLGV